MASLRGGVQLPVLLVVIAVLGCGTAQFQTCYDSANCGGNVVTGVITAQDCCLGDGYSFQISGQCVQCIVHGFERTAVSVDEGAMQETLRVSLDIKGNTLDEPANVRVSTIDLTLMCQDMTTESDDYSTTACGTLIELDRGDPAHLSSEVLITFLADNNALESTEDLSLRLVNTQNEVTTAGNIFFQNTSIQIRDTTVLRSGFEEQDHSGREGLDRRSTLPGIPCTVVIRLQGTTIEHDLTFRLTPRTVSENINMGGPPPTGELRNANASRMDFNDTQPFEVTMAAGTEAVRADIPIVDDEINESTEDFVVVLEVVSNTTNPVEFTIQTTICRIPGNDPIEIGFTQARIEHNETQRTFITSLEKDRQSEQTFVVRIQISTPSIRGVGEPATPERTSPQVPPNPLADFRLGNRLLLSVRLTPNDNRTVFQYSIFQDSTPENTEIFQLSSDPDPDTPNNPDFNCDNDPMFQFNGRDCFPDLQILILDDDRVVIGYVETLVEVDESDGRATLNVIISFPEPDPLLQFQIMFRLDATMMSSTAGARPASAGRFDPIIPGLHDYQEIAPGSVLPRDFEDTRRLQTFNVVMYEDDVPEDVEELNITLSLQDPRLSDRVFVTPAVATVRIRDSDRLTVGFERTAYVVNETDGQVELCVIVIQPAEQNIGDVTFNLTVETRDGTAVGSGMDADYISVMTTLATFTIDQPRQCFNVTIVGDTEVELTENFFANLTLIPDSVTTIDPSRITVAPGQATVNIIDSDLRIMMGYVDTAVTVFESAGVAELTVAISEPNLSVTVNSRVSFFLLVNTIDGTATAPGDYGALTGFSLGPFSNSVRQLSFNVSIVNDVIPEGNEVFNASLTLSPADQDSFGDLVTVAPDLASVTILDDDVITVGCVDTAVSVFESAGVAELTVAISVPNPSVTIETSFSLLVDTNDGTATAAAPSDHDALTGFLLGPFSNSVRQLSFNVPIMNDAIPEDDKDFTAHLTLLPADQARLRNRVTVQPDSASVTILDDDVITVGYVETDVTVSESAGVAQLTVAISVPPQGDPIETSFTLLVNTFDRTAAAPGDYGALTGFSLGPFSNDVRQLSFYVSIVNDMIPEDDERFIANLTLLPADQARLRNRVTVQPDSATVTIQDDDAPRIQFQPDSYTVNEASGFVNITIVTNRLNVNGSALFYTQDGTATAANDFTGIASANAVPVNFSPQSLSTVVRVPIQTDSTPEGTEQFFGRLRSSGTIADLTIPIDGATVDILDGAPPESTTPPESSNVGAIAGAVAASTVGSVTIISFSMIIIAIIITRSHRARLDLHKNENQGAAAVSGGASEVKVKENIPMAECMAYGTLSTHQTGGDYSVSQKFPDGVGEGQQGTEGENVYEPIPV